RRRPSDNLQSYDLHRGIYVLKLCTTLRSVSFGIPHTDWFGAAVFKLRTVQDAAKQYAEHCCSGIDDKVCYACMPTGRKILKQLESATEDDRDRAKNTHVDAISDRRDQAGHEENGCMLEVVAYVGNRPQFRRHKTEHHNRGDQNPRRHPRQTLN